MPFKNNLKASGGSLEYLFSSVPRTYNESSFRDKTDLKL